MSFPSTTTQELEDLLVKKAAEIQRCKAQTTEVRGELERERKVADGHRVAAAEAHASTRWEIEMRDLPPTRPHLLKQSNCKSN